MKTVTKPSLMSRGAAATLACVWEVTAPKPGNVYRGADFDDVTYQDFIDSAVVIGPVFERAQEAGVGRTVFDAVGATREAVGTNTNLGTLLLLAPLAAVPDGMSHADGIGKVLAGLTHDDAWHVYTAIRLSGAGGLGDAREADVFDDFPANLNLVEAMRLAADFDLVARQYTNNFADVLAGTVEWIASGIHRNWPLSTAIVHAHLSHLARHGDSLIYRKCGQQVSDEARNRASHVLAVGIPGDDAYGRAVADFDRWLRGDGHRRNPGTTADFIAAGLFVLLREGRIESKDLSMAPGGMLSPR
ncbi:MAG: triphosphoribosyl-dephospho-CoA synthase [Pirellulales bacterium]